MREIIPYEIPDGDYETLGGYLLHKMEKIPQRNESYRQGDILFIIEDADMKSIREVLIVLPENADKLK